MPNFNDVQRDIIVLNQTADLQITLPARAADSIIESCRRRGIDPHEYLRDVLTRITETTNWQVCDLTPENWAKTKAALKKAA